MEVGKEVEETLFSASIIVRPVAGGGVGGQFNELEKDEIEAVADYP